jgi:hypothetical protein
MFPGSCRCAFYRITASGPQRTGLIQAGEELVLALEIRAGGQPREVVVEFWRGDRRRDRWVHHLGSGDEEHRLFRLHWGETGGSSRLTCRVLIDGREVARRTALLGPGQVDAQGRLPDRDAARAVSAATLLAFTQELDQQLSRPGGT